MQFFEILKLLREEHGMTQQQLAEKLNITRSTVAGYETKRKEPDFNRLTQIAKVFNVTTDYLLGNDAGSESSKDKTFICIRNRGKRELITQIPDEYVERLNNLLKAGLPEVFSPIKNKKD